MLSIEMEGFDPENNRFDLFFVDGASNVQGAGGVVEAILTRVYIIHRSEHVLDLFSNDITKIPEIKVRKRYDTSSLFFYY